MKEARARLLERMGGEGSGILTNDMVLEEVKRTINAELETQQRYVCLCASHMLVWSEAYL